MHIIILTKEYIDDLNKFLVKNDSSFFTPHKYTKDILINNICSIDKYYLMIKSDIIIGYGMLRGYEEGYDIPSLGIMIDKDYRGKGYSKKMINFLENETYKTSEKIRLTVFKKNKIAISLYKSMGYVFEDDNEKSLIGFKILKNK